MGTLTGPISHWVEDSSMGHTLDQHCTRLKQVGLRQVDNILWGHILHIGGGTGPAGPALAGPFFISSGQP